MTTSRNILTPWEYYKRKDGTIIRTYNGTTQFLSTRTRSINWRHTPIGILKGDIPIARASINKERAMPRPLYTYWRSPTGFIYRTHRYEPRLRPMVLGNNGRIAWGKQHLHAAHINTCTEITISQVSKEFIEFRKLEYARLGRNAAITNNADTTTNTTTNTGEKDEC